MATPATPDTTDKIGSTTDESKGGLFNTGDATVLTTLSSSIEADVTAAQTAADEAAASATTADEKATAAAISAESKSQRRKNIANTDWTFVYSTPTNEHQDIC